MIVKHLNGEAVHLDVDVSILTFGGLQQLISEQPKLNIPKEKQRLIHAGKVLVSHETQALESLGIEDDAIIHLCNDAPPCPIL